MISTSVQHFLVQFLVYVTPCQSKACNCLLNFFIQRKPKPVAVRDIGGWYLAFRLTAIVSIISNCGLIALDLRNTAGTMFGRKSFYYKLQRLLKGLLKAQLCSIVSFECQYSVCNQNTMCTEKRGASYLQARALAFWLVLYNIQSVREY